MTAMPAGVSSVVGSRRRWMLGSRRVGGACLPRLAVDGGEERPAAEGVPSSLRIAESSIHGRPGAFREPPRMGALKASRSGDNGPYRQLRSEDAPAGAARVRTRRRSQAGTAGADLRGSPHRSLPLALVVVESDDKSMCYVLPRGADGGRSSISVQEAGGIRWELMPGTRNVVRFPVELVAKPTSDLLRSVAPDGLDEPPMEVRNASDRAM